jgi:transposase
MVAGWSRRSAIGEGDQRRPDCGEHSKSRHSWHNRRLQDLPVQGERVALELRLGRWRCRNRRCERQTFVERLPALAAPVARRTHRVIELLQLLGHTARGRPGEMLAARLAIPASDNTILRQLKRRAATRAKAPVRVAGIDDWSWRKGWTYGTIIVDLERREVVDVIAERSMEAAADWFAQHPEVEVVCRDWCGLYAQGARESAPQARQVADRFHLLQNLRESIEQRMTRISRFAGRSLLSPTDSCGASGWKTISSRAAAPSATPVTLCLTAFKRSMLPATRCGILPRQLVSVCPLSGNGSAPAAWRTVPR